MILEPRYSFLTLLVGCIIVIGNFAGGIANGETADVPPEVAKVIGGLREHLAGIDDLRFNARLTEETVFADTHKIQFEGTMEVAMKRPASLAVDMQSDYHNRSYRLHEGIFTVFDQDVNVYVQVGAAGPFSEALKVIALDYGADMPMSDLLSEQAYELLVSEASRVVYIGIGAVDDRMCHHIAGSVRDIDWQIWIRSEGDPWLCKYIITDREKPMAPQFVVRFNDWEVRSGTPEGNFRFVAPEGAEQIEFLRASSGEAQ